MDQSLLIGPVSEGKEPENDFRWKLAQSSSIRGLGTIFPISNCFLLHAFHLFAVGFSEEQKKKEILLPLLPSFNRDGDASSISSNGFHAKRIFQPSTPRSNVSFLLPSFLFCVLFCAVVHLFGFALSVVGKSSWNGM
jgi:hypothetical protein